MTVAPAATGPQHTGARPVAPSGRLGRVPSTGHKRIGLPTALALLAVGRADG
ncbi:hypothetical protein RKE30_19510 [Streptomyces sp. Li-HN-5-11]|uniref:hypothetical protein n=1 Tax=Streptomyces sp. Li-HN-5-11 TaxID=3075432 RepID=UPI0028B204B7|nr:hypothetical protein [Streptomyces sp. Li-HN-5-11]WNM32443.1 hypothetical protein RKE30_19510 [Streptomyces sp. Li-HN-5-11]WOP38802.1 hypothetical protein RKE32_36115 [Streptomyces sp. Li-HN-5-13]